MFGGLVETQTQKKSQWKFAPSIYVFLFICHLKIWTAQVLTGTFWVRLPKTIQNFNEFHTIVFRKSLNCQTLANFIYSFSETKESISAQSFVFRPQIYSVFRTAVDGDKFCAPCVQPGGWKKDSKKLCGGGGW